MKFRKKKSEKNKFLSGQKKNAMSPKYAWKEMICLPF